MSDSTSLGDKLIEISCVDKRFHQGRRETLALKEVSLTIQRGEFVCLLGPSGCGKSTLLRIVAGFATPDSGEVRINGMPLAGPGADRCMLFQSAALFPWLTVEQNALFGPKAQGALTREARERVASLIATAELRGFEGHYPHQLSGGMRQRAAFVRALVMQPSVLLMDEPFGALDAITRLAMQSFLLSLTETQSPTVLFVTHDVGEATLLADRVVVMSPRPGRIAYDVDVGLERPRGADVVETMEFVRVRKVLRERLENVIEEATHETSE